MICRIDVTSYCHSQKSLFKETMSWTSVNISIEGGMTSSTPFMQFKFEVIHSRLSGYLENKFFF